MFLKIINYINLFQIQCYFCEVINFYKYEKNKYPFNFKLFA